VAHILYQATDDDTQTVHPDWCDLEGHSLTGMLDHAGPVVELPGATPEWRIAGWLAAPEADSPVTFQVLDGPALDTDTLRAIGIRMIELAAQLTA